MSLDSLRSESSLVRLGGWRIGPLAGGGAWYEVRPLTLVQWLDFQQACAGLNGDGETTMIETATIDALRALLPVMLAQPIKLRHLRGATATQVVAAVAEFSRVTDIETCTRAFAPVGGEGKGMPFEALLCALGRDFHVDPQTIAESWPLRKLVTVLEGLKALVPTEDDAELEKYGLDGEGYEVVR